MRQIYAEHILLPTGWAQKVRLSLAADGRIDTVDTQAEPGEAYRTEILLPALSNLHSHSFQRALAGLTEKRGASSEDFWAWREVMYRFLPKLDPDAIEAIAAQLQVELLESGWAAMAEFHYLHHAAGGEAYADLAETSGRIAAAARDTGIGLTLLPVLYGYSDFGGAAPGDGQRRFINSPDRFARLVEAARRHLSREDDRLGIAPHSLRAVTPETLASAVAAAPEGPVHIHIAEQVKEVEACLAWSGARPVEWLLDQVDVDPSWCLVHATHMTADETVALARSGAVAGLCPTTEADLGDGVFPAPDYLSAGGAWGLGTDSHVRRCPVEEMRMLEWSQRLTLRKRNVFAPANGSTGRALYDGALAGGAQALKRDTGRIEAGLYADLVALDARHPALASKRVDDILDSWIFAGGADCVRDVWSAGRHLVRDSRHVDGDRIASRFKRTMQRLTA